MTVASTFCTGLRTDGAAQSRVSPFRSQRGLVEPASVRWQFANRTRSRTLATLRDTLLPKLLSGEIGVGEIPSSN